MKSKRLSRITVIFTMILIFTTSSVSAAPQNQTVDIAETNDDGFNTEVGIGIDAHLLTILDPSMDIRAYLVFEDIDINPWEVLTNATLRLTSASTLPFDADSSVTVYGMKQSDLGSRFTNTTTLSPGEIVSMPLTSAHTNVNTSQFYGGAVLDINVTEIIRELYTDPHWDGHGYSGANLGDDMGFIILGAPDETRYFYDYRGDPVRSADLIIHWGHVPPGPAGGDFNESYRDLNIWEVDQLGENRTGINADVNWNLLNQSELTELDSGAAITVQNATWTTLQSFDDQQVNSLYNDTGSTNVASFFVRFAMNITDVQNNQAGNAYAGCVVGIGTATPVGSVGMKSGDAGDHVGLLMMNEELDTTYLFRLYERSGVDRRYSGTSGWITENTGINYFEYYATNTWESIRMYSDPGFTVLVWEDDRAFETASGPFRYTRIIESIGQWGPGGVRINDADYYTYLEMPVANATIWIVTFQNGTQIGNTTDYDSAIILADDFLGPDPSDPNPPSQGWDPTGPFTRFNTRFYILALGMGLFWGPLMVFAYERPSGYEFVIGAFIMLVGIAFMISAGSV